MNWQKAIVWLSGAIYLQSMVLAVIGTTTKGWQAFRMSLLIWTDFKDLPASLIDPFSLLLRAGGVANLIFIAGFISLLRQKNPFRALPATLAVCTLIDAQWIVFMSHGQGLRIGYYAWLSAFVLLTVGAFTRASAHRADASREVVHAKTPS